MPQLDPTWFASQLFWLFVCFTFLYLVLSKAVLPSLQSVMSTRKETVEGDVGTAQALKSQAESIKNAYEQTLIESRGMAQALLNEAEQTTKAQAEQSIKALDVQLSTQLKNSSAAIAAKKQELLDALMPATAEFTSLIVEKLTRHAPSEQQVQQALTNVVKTKQ